MARPRAGDEGFTLVEVMVAMGIFLIVSAATLSLITTSLDTVRGNADRVYAAALARSEVESLRTLGSAAVPLGASERSVSTDAGDFTITRTATWVDVGAPTNPCEVGPGVTPGKSYLRVRVDVIGGDLEAPQTVEGIVYPRDTPPTENTGTLTVQVSDDVGQPVSGVSVTGTNGAGQTFQQTTGPDGCIFAPDLAAGANWSVVIAKPGYITEQPNGQSSSGVVVNELQNTPLTFAYAASGSLIVAAGHSGFPVPAGMPFRFQPNTLNNPANASGGYPVTISGLWPDDYTAWLLPCSASTAGSTASVTLAAGGSAAMALGGTRVELVGPEGENVRAIPASPCSNDYPLGAWAVEDRDGLTFLVPTGVSLPDGTWTLTSAGESRTIVLSSSVGRCSVKWPDPNALTEAEYDDLLNDPDLPLTPADLEDFIIRPEVSDPCPTAP
jgi:prepilin-type N-terminal cleavage/methylation domain-containing protein